MEESMNVQRWTTELLLPTSLPSTLRDKQNPKSSTLFHYTKLYRLKYVQSGRDNVNGPAFKPI